MKVMVKLVYDKMIYIYLFIKIKILTTLINHIYLHKL